MRIRFLTVRLTATAGALGLLAAALGVAGAAPPAPPPIKVIAREFAYEPKEFTARSGEMIFSVQNAGAIEHNFLIDDPAKKTVAKIAVISPGEIEQVRVTLRAGTYAIYCDLPGHREAGMSAPLRVRD
jgi:uncharacterized cupredoxin-like copper-binding protein